MENYKKEALKLAKNSILEEFGKNDLSNYVPENNELKIKGACFVTLKIFGDKLRGCIGSIIPHRELYQDIIENAKSRAFSDPRFSPLSEDELDNINIDISILSVLKEIHFDIIEELLDYLKKNKPGLVIKLGYKQATFLPSVWEELPNENDFLKHLIFKAGISIDEFRLDFDNLEVFEYYSEEFGEKFSKI